MPDVAGDSHEFPALFMVNIIWICFNPMPYADSQCDYLRIHFFIVNLKLYVKNILS